MVNCIKGFGKIKKDTCRKLIVEHFRFKAAAVVQVKSGVLRRPIRKLYKLELCAEADNLPPITSSPENSDNGDAMLGNEVGRMDDKEEEVEREVILPQRTRRGRQIVHPRRY